MKILSYIHIHEKPIWGAGELEQAEDGPRASAGATQRERDFGYSGAFPEQR